VIAIEPRRRTGDNCNNMQAKDKSGAGAPRPSTATKDGWIRTSIEAKRAFGVLCHA
jgi:hypothetical protein